MCAPAAAALLVAALAAIPCRGIDADSSSSNFNETQSEATGSHPTINKFYQMLHTTIHNHTKLNDFNSSVNINSLKLYNSLSTSVDKTYECCRVLDDTDQKDELSSSKGAQVVVQKVNVNVYKNRKRRFVNIIRKDENVTMSDITKKVETSTMTWSSSQTPAVPVVMERKRKPGETGSSAPLLNYIFDSYSSTHQHRNGVNSGNSIYAAGGFEVEALVGTTAQLDCKVDALHDKLVSWVRRKNDEDPMTLLTTGSQLYTADDRYSAKFIPPDIWRLEVRDVRPTDAANYDCQLSAHPPRTARVTLRVPEVSVHIVDGAGASVSEQVCEVGSTVALRCEVRGLRMEGGPSLLWYRRESLLNDDTTRGGISVRTEFGANGANSVLRVARVRADDAGRYTCMVARAPPPEPEPAHVLLHIIKGRFAAQATSRDLYRQIMFYEWPTCATSIAARAPLPGPEPALVLLQINVQR
ncbi:hypothetical protein O0L34_g7235 [Tuta absoluta]|nr:hypothetical protein O0L34_g7235 [Tuta absoluta]